MYDFIETYDNALDAEFCARMISKFEEDPGRQNPGRSSSGVNPKIKDTMEVAISTHPDWTEFNQKVLDVTKHYMVEYVRKYSHLLFGIMGSTIMNEHTGEITEITHDIVKDLPASTVHDLAGSNYRLAPINMQKYLQGQGAYHKWHSEISPTHPQGEILHRVLFTIFYLNDVNDGGETEFFYQQKSVKPKQGRLVIAPGGFTHTHKGHVPLSGDKYILASWIKYKRFETLFQGSHA